jgi:hypothetical protein
MMTDEFADKNAVKTALSFYYGVGELGAVREFFSLVSLIENLHDGQRFMKAFELNNNHLGAHVYVVGGVYVVEGDPQTGRVSDVVKVRDEVFVVLDGRIHRLNRNDGIVLTPVEMEIKSQ